MCNYLSMIRDRQIRRWEGGGGVVSVDERINVKARGVGVGWGVAGFRHLSSPSGLPQSAWQAYQALFHVGNHSTLYSAKRLSGTWKAWLLYYLFSALLWNCNEIFRKTCQLSYRSYFCPPMQLQRDIQEDLPATAYVQYYHSFFCPPMKKYQWQSVSHQWAKLLFISASQKRAFECSPFWVCKIYSVMLNMKTMFLM